MKGATELSLPERCYHVRLLGPFAVSYNGVALDTDAWRPQSARLFRLIASSPEGRISRDDAIDALWPDAGPEAGDRNLRFTLHMLRRSMQSDGSKRATAPVRSEPGWVLLDPGHRWEIDLRRFEAAVRAIPPDALAANYLPALEAAASLYTGEPLPADRYADWAQPVRDRIERTWRSLRLRLARAAAEAGDPAAAITWLERVLSDDPLDEEAVQQLMQVLSGSGRTADALRHYRRLEAALAEELAVIPAPETRLLAETLLRREPASGPDPLPATRLPSAATGFVGRETEIAELRALLARPEVRLVTLTGAGGSGKTRLALELARRSLTPAGDLWEGHEGGAIFVPLAGLDDPALVPFAMAEAIGLRPSGTTPVIELLSERIGGHQTLLLLDNLEHLLDSVLLIPDLLDRCPGLKVLATSRIVLRLAAEFEFPVPPLNAPAGSLVTDPQDALAYDAVRLFLQRAEAVRPDFRLTPATTAEVVTICRSLDNLPLAIELAASRLRHLSAQDLVSRLDASLPAAKLDLLAAGPRDAPGRHQTLRRTIDWSYALLPPDAATLFARLAVFAGGWTLAAAEEVCGGGLSGVTVLDGLGILLENSLVRRDPGDEEREERYGMLETIRSYAAERLRASGEEESCWRRLADYLVRLAEEAESQLEGAQAGRWLNRLAAEHDTLRAVLRRLLDGREREQALRLAAALTRFWQRRGHYAEGYGWFTETLAEVDAVPPRLPYARAIHGAGILAATRGEFAAATEWFTRGLAAWQALGETARVAGTLNNLGVMAQEQGEYERARRLHLQALPLLEELGDIRGMASSLNNLGIIERESGDEAKAADFYQEALPLVRQIGWDHGVASILNNLGILARRAGDLDRSEVLYRESLAIHRRLGDPKGIATVLTTLGNLMSNRGDLGAARALHEEAIALSLQAGDREVPLTSLEDLASIIHRQGDHLRAAHLLAAADALRRASGHPIPPAEAQSHERLIEEVRAGLGAAAFDAAWEEGQCLDLPAAAARAVSREP